MKKYFGTDGIRGRVGTFPITPEFVLKLGWAFGKVLASQNLKAGLNGDSNYDYNHVYGNPCNLGDWIENEVNLYVNETMAKQEDSDLNNLFRNSMIGMFYIGKSCEDFVNDLPTGTNESKNCSFSNSEERCVGYLCTTKNINKSDPSSTICDGKLNNNNTTYKDVKNEAIKRTERSKHRIHFTFIIWKRQRHLYFKK